AGKTTEALAVAARISAAPNPARPATVPSDTQLLPPCATPDLNGRQAAQLTETLRSAHGPPSANENHIPGTTTAKQAITASSSSAEVSGVAPATSVSSGSIAEGPTLMFEA